MKNVGLLIDFWHLSVSNYHIPDTVKQLNKELIFGVHICDGVAPQNGKPWDELVQKNYAVGEGSIDIQAWTDAIKSTGYGGFWSYDLVSPVHWERGFDGDSSRMF